MAELLAIKQKSQLARAVKYYGLTEQSFRRMALNHFLKITKDLPGLGFKDGEITFHPVKKDPADFWKDWAGRN